MVYGAVTCIDSRSRSDLVAFISCEPKLLFLLNFFLIFVTRVVDDTLAVMENYHF